MSRLLILALAVIAVFAGFSAYQKAQAQVAETASAVPKNNGKILIAYYSWSGHTKKVAEAIQNEIGGDLFEIQPETAYSDDYKTVVDQAKKEINEGYRPALKNNVANIAQYDIVFIGSPNWWGTIAPVVSTFVEQNDLSGKTVVPFITHGSGGEQNTITDLEKQCKDCLVQKNGWVGYGSRTWGISGWLEDIGFKK